MKVSRLIAVAALLLLSLFSTVHAISVVSQNDPNVFVELPGQPRGNSDAHALTPVSSIIPSNWAVIVTLGQSNIASTALGTYTTVSPNAKMLNVYDGGVYACANPVLGASIPIAGLGSNSANCQIADGLISSGVFPGVLIVALAIDGTSAANWNGPQLSGKISAAWNRIISLGLRPTYILWHQGEQDVALNLNTPGPAYTASVQSVAMQWRNLGYTGNFIVALETLVSGVTDATIRAAQAATVSVPLCIVQGADWDTLTGANRNAGLHWTQLGATNAAALDVTVITSLHNAPHC